MKPKHSKFRIFFYSKSFIFFGLILVLLTSVSFFKEYSRQKKINKKILELRQEFNNIQEDNFELAKMINYLKTDDYAEMEARKTLGLKKQGETVIVVNSKNNGEVAGIKDENEENWEKWMRYFFGG